MKTLSTTLSASQARSNFYNILDQVSKKFKRYIVTRRGAAKAVIMPSEEVEGWEETMEIIANKKLVKDILKSEQDRRLGKAITEKKLLKELDIPS